MKKLLLVEDNELNRELATQILEDDYDIAIAEHGQAALDMLADVAPDIILMDLSMPVLDGWSTIERIRSQENGTRVPIIALSAHAVQAEIDRAYKSGCDDFVTKPIDDDELLAKLGKLLAE